MLRSHLHHDDHAEFVPAVLDEVSDEPDIGEHGHNSALEPLQDISHLKVVPGTTDSDVQAAEALRRLMARREGGWGLKKAAMALRGLHGWSTAAAASEKDDERVAAQTDVVIPKELLKDAGIFGC
jgi:hypothetical protein